MAFRFDSGSRHQQIRHLQTRLATGRTFAGQFRDTENERGATVPTIIKRGDRWQARVRRQGYPPQSDTFRTKAAAERWARDVEAKMDAGAFQAVTIEARRVTLGDALQRYAAEVTPKKRGGARERQRIQAWRAHQLAARPLSNIKPDDLAAHIRDREAEGCGPNTIRLELALLSHVFTVARKRWGMAGLLNPVKDTDKPSTTGTARTRRLKPGEEAQLLQACDDGPAWLSPLVTLAIETAMRRGELASLTDEAIDGVIAHLPKTKNGDARDVPLSPAAQTAIQGIRKAQGGRLVMPAPITITHAFGDATKAAGLQDLHFHDLRREATSRLFERGLGIQEVAAITGHRTWAMLAVYTKPRAEDLAKKLAEKKPAGAG